METQTRQLPCDDSPSGIRVKWNKSRRREGYNTRSNGHNGSTQDDLMTTSWLAIGEPAPNKSHRGRFTRHPRYKRSFMCNSLPQSQFQMKTTTTRWPNSGSAIRETGTFQDETRSLRAFPQIVPFSNRNLDWHSKEVARFMVNSPFLRPFRRSLLAIRDRLPLPTANKVGVGWPGTFARRLFSRMAPFSALFDRICLTIYRASIPAKLNALTILNCLKTSM